MAHQFRSKPTSQTDRNLALRRSRGDRRVGVANPRVVAQWGHRSSPPNLRGNSSNVSGSIRILSSPTAVTGSAYFLVLKSHLFSCVRLEGGQRHWNQILTQLENSDLLIP